MSGNGVCWMGGEIVALDQARVSVLDHGFLYGDGVFEGIRFYAGRPFMLEAHLVRLGHSARALALELPWSRNALDGIVREVINRYGESDGYLRLIITRGSGPLGINPASCREPQLIVIADQLQMSGEQQRRQGIRTIIAATRRLPVDGLDPRIKSLNYLNHILARMEANHAGVEEALMLNQRGFLAEGSADNVFVVRAGRLCTPPTSDGALEGITRNLVIQLAVHAGITVSESSLAPYDLYSAEECFVTGTGAELIPVRDVDGRALAQCPGPVYQQLAQAFQQRIKEDCHVMTPDHRD